MNQNKILGAALAVCCIVIVGGCGSSAGEGAAGAHSGTAAVTGSEQTGASAGTSTAGTQAGGTTVPVERIRLKRSALPEMVKLPGQLASFERLTDANGKLGVLFEVQ